MSTELEARAQAPTASLDDALAFVREHADGVRLGSGEMLVEHAQGTARLVNTLNVDPPSSVAAALFPVIPYLSDPECSLRERFGEDVLQLVTDVRKLLRLGVIGIQATTPDSDMGRDAHAHRRAQVEALRKMLVAFAQDIRVVLIRLASRLQTLRFYAAHKLTPPVALPRETLEIYAPLANRLGIWQLKWELEDLAFRFEDPVTYKRIAKLLDERRVERELYVHDAIERLKQELAAASIDADMRGKKLEFSELNDVRAFRVIVPDVKDCYTVLGIVHNIWQPVPREFDDYISRPKPNGYKSLHTVVIGDDGRAFEVQIRTHDMHRFAEYGIAAHWRYKEAGARGYSGQFASNDKYDEKIAWLRQLLAWKDDVSGSDQDAQPWEQWRQTPLDDHIYVLTPQARVIALPQAATPVDFAYYVHSELGHRCRGAYVDGAMVPLNTPLQNGQTVEIVAVKQGGPSRDWLNPQLGYLHGARAKQKVRAWFNAIELQETVASGRAAVEKILQREGRTSVNLDELAAKLGFKAPDELFLQVGKDELSPRAVEQALRDAPPPEPSQLEPASFERRSSGSSVASGASTGVLVVGVDALLTQLTKCCRPAPPDEIAGFVTRGKGVSIHRSDCASFLRMAARAPERVLPTSWSSDVLSGRGQSVYPIDLSVEAIDRQGLLRDITEVFAREKINLVGVKTQTRRNVAHMQFTVEVSNSVQVQRAATLLGEVQDVVRASRRK
ncbi:hypothetical protein DFQ30_001100 [Apophysomyces sp. BC1015]|nr:hypothetical protein DFQ30_001100 [Apophysomyces sp. BC1015]